ncbi:family 16 glycoside hydrolase, partial [Micromonospora echinofusca]
MRNRRSAHRRGLLLAAGAAATAVALVAGFGATAHAATLFGDDFGDGNADGWSKSGGTWTVSSGELTQSATGSELARQFAGNTAWTDYQVQARVKPVAYGANGLVGIAARASSSTKMYRLALFSGGRAELQAVNGSQISSLGSASVAVGTGTWATLRIEASGTTIRGFVNGTQVGSGTDSMEDNGRVALVTAYAAATFDDVVASDNGSTPTTPPTTTAPPTTPP